MMYSDETINYFGRIFTTERLHSRLGITFDAFLDYPGYWLREAVHSGYEPLLPAQRAVARRILTDEQRTGRIGTCEWCGTIDHHLLIRHQLSLKRRT